MVPLVLTRSQMLFEALEVELEAPDVVGGPRHVLGGDEAVHVLGDLQRREVGEVDLVEVKHLAKRALMWMVAQSIKRTTRSETLVSDDSRVGTNKQRFQPWLQSGAGFCPSTEGGGSCDSEISVFQDSANMLNDSWPDSPANNSHAFSSGKTNRTPNNTGPCQRPLLTPHRAHFPAHMKPAPERNAALPRGPWCS